MSKSARNFLVYACSACGKRIFTHPDHRGRRGRCPLCDEHHIVGGPRVAETGEERRGSPRVRLAHARVELRRRRGGPDPDSELYALEDLSVTGIGFMVQGTRDGRTLRGISPPDIHVDDLVSVTLHQGGLERPRVYAARVRRIVPPTGRDQVDYLVGAEFADLTSAQVADLERLVQSLLGG